MQSACCLTCHPTTQRLGAAGATEPSWPQADIEGGALEPTAK